MNNWAFSPFLKSFFFFNGKLIRATFQKPDFQLCLQTPFPQSSPPTTTVLLLRLAQGQTDLMLGWSDEGQSPWHFILHNWADRWRRWNSAVFWSLNNQLVPKVGLMDHYMHLPWKIPPSLCSCDTWLPEKFCTKVSKLKIIQVAGLALPLLEAHLLHENWGGLGKIDHLPTLLLCNRRFSDFEVVDLAVSRVCQSLKQCLLGQWTGSPRVLAASAILTASL